MRVLLFIGKLVPGGGGEKILTMIANHLAENGWEVCIATLLSSKVDREHFHLDNRINVVDIHPVHTKGYSKNVIFWLRNIRKIAVNSRPDVIISFFGRINALVLTATIGIDTPVVVSERNNPKRDRRGKLMLKYCDWIYRRAKAIVFQTRYEQSCFSAIHAPRSLVIHNPIEIEEVREVPIERNLIVSVGKLERQKNQQMLIKAIEIVRERIPKVRCEIYGEGTLRKELQQVIDKLGLQNNVALAGKSVDILDRIAKCQVFVMTSDYEGLSNAQMEAMMLGKICVSTDYEGVEELISDGENGVIVPRNDVNRLADVLSEILLDEDGDDDEMGQNARKRILAFDSPIILNQWSNLLQSIIQ